MYYYSKCLNMMYTYHIDTNTTALLIRVALDNFLTKSPLFGANFELNDTKKSLNMNLETEMSTQILKFVSRYLKMSKKLLFTHLMRSSK